MEKRFQVFVSSTYIDLIDERSEIMQALLELNCMPAGMELFPAANDAQWDWIKKVIDESDYYIVVIGGRYGSISQRTNLSYTEMEYRYAIKCGKPVIGFLHENPDALPAGRSEKSIEGINKLEDFRVLVQKRLCKFWSSPTDLGAKVSRSLTQLIKQTPAVGWIRADFALEKGNAEEILQLKRRIEELESELDKVSTEKPRGTELLSSGSDNFSVKFYYRRKRSRIGKESRKVWFLAGDETDTIELSWDEIFTYIAYWVMKGLDSNDMNRVLNNLVEKYGSNKLEEESPEDRFEAIEIAPESVRAILIQLRALKLISWDSKKTIWSLTPYGDNYMTSVMAVHK